MATTSIKLPADLKKRVAAAAHGRGITAHAFMVSAIEESARAAELRASFVADAQKARKATLKSGKAFEVGQVHDYLQRRIKGQRAARPKAVSWRG